MIRRLLIVLVLAAAATTALVVAGSWPWQHAAEESHYHAGFVVVSNGQAIDFSNDAYMHLKACGEADEHENLTPEEERLKRIHLHDNVGDVAHVHGSDVRWSELFTNLEQYVFAGPPTVYRNGQRLEENLAARILPDDRILIIADAIDQTATNLTEALRQVPTIERIREVEAAGESC